MIIEPAAPHRQAISSQPNDQAEPEHDVSVREDAQTQKPRRRQHKLYAGNGRASQPNKRKFRKSC
jgi:hypothetical protein